MRSLRIILAALVAAAMLARNCVEGDVAALSRLSGLNFQTGKLPCAQLLPPALGGKAKSSESSVRCLPGPAEVLSIPRKYLKSRAPAGLKKETGELPNNAHLLPEVLQSIHADRLARMHRARLLLPRVPLRPGTAGPSDLFCACVLALRQVVGLHARPAFCGEALVDSDENLFEHLRVHLRHRLARPAQTVLHKFGLERSASSGRLRARKDGPGWRVLAQVGARCRENPLVPVGLSVAQSLGRACLELVCAQNRFLTLGMRIGREVLLTLRDQEPGEHRQGNADEGKADGPPKKAAVATRICRILWACKEVVLLTWLENARGISAACAPEPLKLGAKTAGRAIIGRAMRLWGEGLAQRIIHGPVRGRSRFSLGRLSRITTVLGGACTGAGIGAASAGAAGASAPEAAWAATACAAIVAAASVDAVSRFGEDTGSKNGRKGLVLSAADANALLLGASFLGFGLVGGRYTIAKTGDVHLNGCLCQGLDEDEFRNPHPSAIFGRTHEDDMSLAHLLASMPFSLVDCLLGCMGYMPASVRAAMRDPAVQASALRGGVVSLQGHSLGSIEGRLLKANMAWRGPMMLLSPPPPFGWEEGTVRTCGRFDPICSGPIMSVAKHLRAPVNYVLRDISHQSKGFVHQRPYYVRHMAGADGG
jgi:hypothetical protein